MFDIDLDQYRENQAWTDLGNLGLPFFRTGSREICSPPPMNTDVDFVVLDASGAGMFHKNGFQLGTVEDHEKYGAADFMAYRRGEVNLIVVDTWAQFKAWKAATAAAKQMNIKEKQKRIELFQGVLYGNW
jgi:hypothetical protein